MAALLVVLVLSTQVAISIGTGILNVVVQQGLHRPSPHLERQPLVLAFTNLVAFGGAIALGLFLNRLSFRRAFAIGRFTPLQVAGVALAVLGLDVVLSDFDNWFRTLLPVPRWLANFMKDLLVSDDKLLSRIFLLVIVAPLTEELLFRGIVLRGLLSRYRPAAAVVLSAFLFAVMHCSPWQFFSPWILGILFGWFYLRTSSLGLCVLGHAWANGLGILAAMLPLDIPGFSGTPDFTNTTLQPWWLDLSGFVLLLVGLWIFHRAAPPTQALSTQLPPVITPAAAQEPGEFNKTI